MATGSVWANSSDTLECADSEYPPQLVQVSWLYALYNLSYSHFLCWNLQIFVTMATGVGLSNFWLSPLNRPTLKTPYWVQVYGLYLLSKASYSQFCVKICDFSLPWQQGQSEQFFYLHRLIRYPYPRTKNYDSLTQNRSYDCLNFYHYENRIFLEFSQKIGLNVKFYFSNPQKTLPCAESHHLTY